MLSYVFFAAAIASALALQFPATIARPCEGEACYSSVTNQSHRDFGEHSCQCCFRDCDFDHAANSSLETLYGAASLDVETASTVDAWLVMASCKEQSLDWNMYTPILETVKTALERKHAITVLVRMPDMDKLIAGVRYAAVRGRRPLVFAVAAQFSSYYNCITKYDAVTKLRQAKEAGAYLVSYNTEPAFNEFRTGGVLVNLHRMLHMAEEMAADEIWDYSRTQADHYPPLSNYPQLSPSFTIRYVPPGYTSKFDVGTDPSTNNTNEGRIGYMGMIGSQKPMTSKYMGILGDKMFATNDIRSDAQLRTYLQAYPLQLNIHKKQTCCPRQRWESEYMHMESFRMSILLANKVCVISPPSAEQDMLQFKHMVTYAEVEDTPAIVEKLSGHLHVCRTTSYDIYRHAFDPSRLLEISGFFKTWLPPHGN